MIKPKVRVVKKYQNHMPKYPKYIIEYSKRTFLGIRIWQQFDSELDEERAIARAQYIYGGLEADYIKHKENPPFADTVIWMKP